MREIDPRKVTTSIMGTDISDKFLFIFYIIIFIPFISLYTIIYSKYVSVNCLYSNFTNFAINNSSRLLCIMNNKVLTTKNNQILLKKIDNIDIDQFTNYAMIYALNM